MRGLLPARAEPTGDTLGAFVELVTTTAPHVAGFGPDRAYVSAVFDALGPARGWSIADFKRRLVEAHRKRLVRLSRADLVGAMNAAHVQRSAIVVDRGVGHEPRGDAFESPQFHLIATHNRRPTANDGPGVTAADAGVSWSIPTANLGHWLDGIERAVSTPDGAHVNVVIAHEQLTAQQFADLARLDDDRLRQALSIRPGADGALRAARRSLANLLRPPSVRPVPPSQTSARAPAEARFVGAHQERAAKRGGKKAAQALVRSKAESTLRMLEGSVREKTDDEDAAAVRMVNKRHAFGPDARLWQSIDDYDLARALGLYPGRAVQAARAQLAQIIAREEQERRALEVRSQLTPIVSPRARKGRFRVYRYSPAETYGELIGTTGTFAAAEALAKKQARRDKLPAIHGWHSPDVHWYRGPIDPDTGACLVILDGTRGFASPSYEELRRDAA